VVRPGARTRPGTGGGRWAGRGTRFVGAVDAPAAARRARARAGLPARKRRPKLGDVAVFRAVKYAWPNLAGRRPASGGVGVALHEKS